MTAKLNLYPIWVPLLYKLDLVKEWLLIFLFCHIWTNFKRKFRLNWAHSFMLDSLRLWNPSSTGPLRFIDSRTAGACRGTVTPLLVVSLRNLLQLRAKRRIFMTRSTSARRYFSNESRESLRNLFQCFEVISSNYSKRLQELLWIN